MPLTLNDGAVSHWSVRKIAVVGPGIVGMPMAALLADARIRVGTDEPARVVVIQRNSPTSGWKVDAINAGRSPIGGIEPGLDHVVADAVRAGILSAAHDYAALADADVILISVQTDRDGERPDYGPLLEAIEGIAVALAGRPAGNVPLLVFESTLAPSSMATVIRDRFARHGLVEGRDLLLGNSPNRVMPGRLIERVAASDKLIAGLHSATSGLIRRLYGAIVTRGTLHETNSMTAEVVKTLENAYRDVRIAYAAEVARHCDAHDISFFSLRDLVNARTQQVDTASLDAQAVPSGGLLVPMLGVGGHCLPKDGILLWWRALEAREPAGRSLILESRRINDESPAVTLAHAERALGPLAGRRVALLGAAYRGNSEDTRNSPTLATAALLRQRGVAFTVHDPFVNAADVNLRRHGVTDAFTRELDVAVGKADLLLLCCPHRVYAEGWLDLVACAPRARDVFDACHLLTAELMSRDGRRHAGIGRGRSTPSEELVTAVHSGFEAVERGVANEVGAIVDFLNRRFADGDFNRIRFPEVQRIAATCPTGCTIVAPGEVMPPTGTAGFESRLVARAVGHA
jgi:UDP-N-acetyl-D-mannosaminuronic acid dehydrogenase